ncbi:sensor histidine kinase [Kutzneria albida]|uniref:histidine kinase n=1 Tax=Kutzneria albida DSM 43870 TaxID=1449976 RepID=W5W4Q8_9PSEU|nr:histidine kinase [Kutzneria albida]AHH95872.1 hypothetical protein KALB_2504 [Kutzneria albida DSM 43870]
MDTPFIGWQAVLRRQWPILVALSVLMVIEWGVLPERYGGRAAAVLTALPTALLIGLAVLAVAYPLASALGAAVLIIAVTSVEQTLRIVLHTEFSPVSPVQTAACMVIIAVLVRLAPRNAVWGGLAALAFAGMFAAIRQALVSGWRPQDPSQSFPALMLVVLAIGTGLYFRARDTDRDHTITSAVAAAQQQERIALARELHDVVAHHVTGIVVQAQAAMTVSGKDPLAAHRLLPGIADAGTEALAAMRRLVGTLREENTADAATTDLLSDVRATIEQSRNLGVPIRDEVSLPRPVPGEVARSVLRILQESLINVHKHAVTATLITVQVAAGEHWVRVVVADDGAEPARDPAGGSGGYGLVGMRERVELLGGLFSAGRTGDRGWQVLAELPLTEVRR